MIQQVVKMAEFRSLIDSGKVVVDFFATWCGPCRIIAPKFEEFSKAYNNAVFVKIDVDQANEISRHCAIRSMPTFRVYKDGKQLAEVTGADPAKLKVAIEKNLVY
ncbi:Cytoplasmic thioredoxin isoenzyme 2 [Dinochytrium kinnereticum]|nr:Cytoplasmic thioredoxin isoenzyme 2 [Dinochytrium kinnereticum]